MRYPLPVFYSIYIAQILVNWDQLTLSIRKNTASTSKLEDIPVVSTHQVENGKTENRFQKIPIIFNILIFINFSRLGEIYPSGSEESKIDQPQERRKGHYPRCTSGYRFTVTL